MAETDGAAAGGAGDSALAPAPPPPLAAGGTLQEHLQRAFRSWLVGKGHDADFCGDAGDLLVGRMVTTLKQWVQDADLPPEVLASLKAEDGPALWEVVGGEGTGGLLVREGPELASPACAATGMVGTVPTPAPSGIAGTGVAVFHQLHMDAPSPPPETGRLPEEGQRGRAAGRSTRRSGIPGLAGRTSRRWLSSSRRSSRRRSRAALRRPMLGVIVSVPTLSCFVAMITDPTETVRSLKARLQAETQIPVQGQMLLFNQEELEDGKTLQHYGIQQRSETFNMQLNLRG